MDGTVLLQGGGEFARACREMDLELLRRTGASRVVVTALAGAPGREHDTANRNAVRYYRDLGAADVSAAPDARSDRTGAVDALRDADLVVLPGGSPRRLLTALRDTGAGDALLAVLARGGAVSGASAGAMVLCAWTLLPEGGAPELTAGLGVVPTALALPHYSGDDRWLDAVAGELPSEVVVLGLPECSGVILERTGDRPATLTAVGAHATHLLGSRAERIGPGTVVDL